MPSKSPEQARLMRAVAHGWTPSRMKSPPSRAVAQEFVNADRKYSGGFAENRYARGGLAFMNQVDSNSERARPLRGFPMGGRVSGIAGMYRRARELAEGSQEPDVSPYGTEAGTTQQMLDRMGYSGPMGYLRLTSGLRQAGWTPASGSGDGDLKNTMWYPPEGTLTGEGAPPPRIIPTDPASYVTGKPSFTSSGEGGGDGGGSQEGSPYREQLREHKAKISEILGSARGGHVNYYEEGGAVRPGHAEGPNPYPPDSARYRLWERENHIDPPPPPKAAAEPEDIPWWKKLAGYGAGPTKTDEALEAVGEAHGGRVRYQAGGLAIAAPAGGVPPWISPTGTGPGYMDEPPPGYQFGGIADRFNPPPAAAPAPVGMAAPPAAAVGPPGGLAAMQQQQSRAGDAMARMGGPGGGGFVPAGATRDPQTGLIKFGGYDPTSEGPGGGRVGTQALLPGAIGGGSLDPIYPGDPGSERFRLPGPSGPGQIPDWRQRGTVYDPQYDPVVQQRKMLEGRIGKFPPPGGGGGGIGKPRPAPGTFPDEGGGIPGGARVPPNMRGFLQKQRMMNRPPANVGGGANRVGMADQQGALSRAMQRGTGRPPMSRRAGFGRAGRSR